MTTTASIRRRATAVLAATAGLAALAGAPAQADASGVAMQPDLVASSVGQVGFNQAKITNRSPWASSGGFWVRISAGGTTKGHVWVAGLGAGKSTVITHSAIGAYGYNGSVVVTADATQMVTETDETNNSAAGYYLS